MKWLPCKVLAGFVAIVKTNLKLKKKWSNRTALSNSPHATINEAGGKIWVPSGQNGVAFVSKKGIIVKKEVHEAQHAGSLKEQRQKLLPHRNHRNRSFK